MSTASACALTVASVWLGMVLAISFLEAPLKFRAPGVTVTIGLGIGRLVFRALNACEVVFAGALGALLIADASTRTTPIGLFVAVGSLAAQLIVVRPALKRRSDAVLSGQVGGRSRVHHAYVVLELVKVVALTTFCVLLVLA